VLLALLIAAKVGRNAETPKGNQQLNVAMRTPSPNFTKNYPKLSHKYYQHRYKE